MEPKYPPALSRALRGLFALTLVVMAGLFAVSLFNEAEAIIDEDVIENIEIPTPEIAAATDAETGSSAGFFAGLWEIVVSIWSFFGQFGVIAQLMCCVVPVVLVIVGIANS